MCNTPMACVFVCLQRFAHGKLACERGSTDASRLFEHVLRLEFVEDS